MEILLGTHGLSEFHGYLETVSEHLERLGHEVSVFDADEGRPEAEGLRVVGTARGLPLAPKVIYAQDAYAALLLADLYPLTPQVFALHDDRAELWLPPQLPAVIARVVVFDDRGRDRAKAASLVHEVVRLRRPVDTERFSAQDAPRERPRKVRLHLEHLSDFRRGVVERACVDAGLDADDDADLAIGRGQEILEAMQIVWQYSKQVIEPSAAVAVAAVRRRSLEGARVGIIVSGGNVDLDPMFDTLR